MGFRDLYNALKIEFKLFLIFFWKIIFWIFWKLIFEIFEKWFFCFKIIFGVFVTNNFFNFVLDSKVHNCYFLSIMLILRTIFLWNVESSWIVDTLKFYFFKDSFNFEDFCLQTSAREDFVFEFCCCELHFCMHWFCCLMFFWGLKCMSISSRKNCLKKVWKKAKVHRKTSFKKKS